MKKLYYLLRTISFLIIGVSVIYIIYEIAFSDYEWYRNSMSLYYYSRSIGDKVKMKYYTIVMNWFRFRLMIPFTIATLIALITELLFVKQILGKGHPLIRSYRGYLYFNLAGLIVTFIIFVIVLNVYISPFSTINVLILILLIYGYHLIVQLSNRVYGGIEEEVKKIKNGKKDDREPIPLISETPQHLRLNSKFIFYVFLFLTIIPVTLTYRTYRQVNKFYPDEIIITPSVTLIDQYESQCYTTTKLTCFNFTDLLDHYQLKQMILTVTDDVANHLQDGQYRIQAHWSYHHVNDIDEFTIDETKDGYILTIDADKYVDHETEFLLFQVIIINANTEEEVEIEFKDYSLTFIKTN